MSSITTAQALAVLRATEGAKGNRVELAVSKAYLGVEGKFKSGFSFGDVQLDIGNNSYGRNAYNQILATGVNYGVITQQQSDDFSQYAIRRPDIAYNATYKQVMNELNNTVFDPKSIISDEVNQIIANQIDAYLNKELMTKVNGFLNAHTTGVFDPSDLDYATAVAAVVSAANRTGKLKDFDAALNGNSDPDLSDVKAAWSSQIGKSAQAGDWGLVQKGAANGAVDDHDREL
jgi:hypothetical protein